MIPLVESPATDVIAQRLVERGLCDTRAIERARQIAVQSGQRLEAILIQLGLLTERGLAETYAELLDLPMTQAARYPLDARLRPTMRRSIAAGRR